MGVAEFSGSNVMPRPSGTAWSTATDLTLNTAGAWSSRTLLVNLWDVPQDIAGMPTIQICYDVVSAVNATVQVQVHMPQPGRDIFGDLDIGGNQSGIGNAYWTPNQRIPYSAAYAAGYAKSIMINPVGLFAMDDAVKTRDPAGKPNLALVLYAQTDLITSYVRNIRARCLFIPLQ